MLQALGSLRRPRAKWSPDLNRHRGARDVVQALLATLAFCSTARGDKEVVGRGFRDEEGKEMTITVLLMTMLTGQNHTIVAEYDTPKACEVAAQAHQKVLLENNITVVYSCSPKAGSR